MYNSATKMVFSSAVGFSRNVGYSLIIKPKIELRQLNMSGRIDWTPSVLKVARGNN